MKNRGSFGWTALILSAVVVATACGYRAKPESPPAGKSLEVPRLQRLSGERIDLGASGCDLPLETVFIVRFLVQEDGSTGSVEFTKGEPSSCIMAFVADTVSSWRYEEPKIDGEPTELWQVMSFSTPR